MRENHSAFHKIWFRPRILVDVEKIDFTTTMLGTKCDIPFYVTATALGKLGHHEGEVILTRAAKKHNVIQMIPTLASCSFDEIMDAAEGDQVQWMQLYVNKDREITKKIVQHAEKRGCKGLFITVDAPQLGRREKDMRSKFTDTGSNVQAGSQTDNSQGAARAISSFIDPALSWKDIPWFQSITKMPIILKGVQRVEDVIRAIESGVQGVVLSNHGGRQLDFARSGIEVLAEVMPVLRERGWENRIEIYIDGGVRRATDIIKALCLGAKGVGIGRPFLFAMSAYGQPGVDRAMQLLKDEMEMNMRLIGCSSVDQLNPTLVDTRGLSIHTTSVPVDTLVSLAVLLHFLPARIFSIISNRAVAVRRAPRNQRLAAIHAMARLIGERSPEHIAWCGQVRSVPFKRFARKELSYLDKPEMDALLAAPDLCTRQGVRDHALLLFLYNSGARVTEATSLRVGDLDVRTNQMGACN